MQKLYTILVVLLLLVSTGTYAQVGKEFWFVAPEATSSHADKPVFFRLSNLSNKKTTVTISQPANPSFPQKTFTINPNSFYSQKYEDWNGFKQIENRNPQKDKNYINNKGFLITSSQNITVYYEIADYSGWNPDKFVLKGDNALGTKFLIPSQTIYPNHNENPRATEKADIVATENNTKITIKLPADCSRTIDGNGGETISITLNRGETYSLEALDTWKSKGLGGVEITSNKKVAVTISDDSIYLKYNGSAPGWDMIGDQLIPYNVIGTEYIAVKTHEKVPGGDNNNYLTNTQTVVILATENNTKVRLNGDNSDIKILNKGEQWAIPIDDNAVYIESTDPQKPIYAYQLTAMGNEIGSAVLPHISCTGSKSIFFTRTMQGAFFIQLLTKKNNIDKFTLKKTDGTGSITIQSGNFKEVEGTAGEWYSATLDLSKSVSTTTSYIISNSAANGIFHMGIVDQNRTSLNYGYFSSYSTLNLESVTEKCVGETTELKTLQEPAEFTSYNWYKKEGTSNIDLGKKQSINVTESGTYFVSVSKYGCVQEKYVDVDFTQPQLDIFQDTIEKCTEETIPLSITGTWSDYTWSDDNGVIATNQPTINVSEPGNYILEVEEENCTAADTAVVVNFPPSSIYFDDYSPAICYGESITAKGGDPTSETYRWTYAPNPTTPSTPITGETTSSLTITQGGIYQLIATSKTNLCETILTVDVTVNPLPVFTLQSQMVCPGETATFEVPPAFSDATMYDYLWENGATTQTTTYQTPGEKIWLKITDGNNCSARRPAQLRNYQEPTLNLPQPQPVCDNVEQTLTATQGFSNYAWEFRESGSTSKTPLPGVTGNSYTIPASNKAQHNGTFYITGTFGSGCATKQDSIQISSLASPELIIAATSNMCKGDLIRVVSPHSKVMQFQWHDDPGYNKLYREINAPGQNTYAITATYNGCSTTASATVNTIEIEADFLSEKIECPGGSEVYYAPNNPKYTYEWSDGSTTRTITLSQPDTTFWCEITHVDYGCAQRDSGKYEWYSDMILETEKENARICLGEQAIIKTRSEIANISSWVLNNSTVTDFDVLPNVNSDRDLVITASSAADAGTYDLIAVDENGCPLTDQLELTVELPPNVELGADRTMCKGDTIKISAKDEDFFGYEWTDALGNTIGTDTFAIVNEGTYNLRAWTEFGCEASDALNVTTNDPPSLSLGSDTIRACRNSSVVLGGPNFDYLFGATDRNPGSVEWRNGADNTLIVGGTNELTVEEEGNYVVTAYARTTSASVRCFAIDTIQVEWLPRQEIDFSSDKTVCPQTPALPIEAPSQVDLSTVEYWWATITPTDTIDVGTPDTPLPIQATGDYAFIARNLNTNCIDTSVVNVEVFPLPQVDLAGDTAACFGDTIAIQNQQTERETYLNKWFINDALSNTTFSYFIEGAEPNAEYKLEVTDKLTGCTNADSIILDIVDLPVITDLSDEEICPQGTVTLAPTVTIDAIFSAGTETYQWSNGTNAATATVSDSMDYIVTVTDPLGCSTQDTATLAWFETPTIDLGNDTSFCFGANVELALSPANLSLLQNIQWYKASTSGTDVLIGSGSNTIIDEPGDYYITGLFQGACQTLSSAIHVTEHPLPDVDLKMNNIEPLCEGESLQLDEIQNFQRYEWNGDSNDNQPSKEITTSGTYILRAWDKNGCSNTDQVIVEITNAPLSPLSDEVTICPLENTQLDAGDNSRDYMWSTGATTASIEVFNKGKYWVKITDNTTHCSVIDSFDVNWFATNQVDLGHPDTIICYNTQLTLDAGLYHQYADYKWHNALTTQTIQADLNFLNEVWAVDVNGCKSYDLKMVQVLEKPVIELSPDSFICSHDSIELDVTEYADFYSDYRWFDDSRDIIKTLPDSGTYWFEIYDECEWVGDTMNVSFHPSPILTDSASIDTSQHAKVIIYPSGGTKPYTYAINNGIPQRENYFKDLSSGDYEILVEDANGCQTTATFGINNVMDIEIPPFVTPNGDGINDTWKVAGLERFPETQINIYDRYGKLLFQYNYSELEDGWNGEYNNQPVPSDDYWYVIFLNSMDLIYKGHFTLKR